MERTPLFYMANLGSEIHRVFDFKERELYQEATDAYARSMHIIEKLLVLLEKNPGGTQEIYALKNYLKSSFESPIIDVSPIKQEWAKYFMPYAYKLLSTNNKQRQ